MADVKPDIAGGAGGAGTGSGTDVKPDKGNADQINLKVRDADGTEIQFKIKRTTPMKKLMDAYAQRRGSPPGTYKFLFDGNRLLDDHTPESQEMENMDVIDAMVAQQGGI